MCWLHEKTGGRAKLPGCDGPPYSCVGNNIGFGPTDYWLDDRIGNNRLLELPYRFYIWILMSLHGRHKHVWKDVLREGRWVGRICEECKQAQNLETFSNKR